MSEQTETQPDAVTKVAQDLRAIEDLACHLEGQAIHKANAMIDGTGLPGGDAMVALAPVANLEAWANMLDAAERRGDYPEFDEDDGEPVLQTIVFWTEQLRREHGNEYDMRPTIASEINYLRYMLNWLRENEPHWEDFAEDIKQARTRLENVLYDGVRVERGAPCLYDECKGARLTRKIGDDGSRTDWRCSRCKRTWNEERYAQMVTAAHEATKFEDIAGEMWCSVDYAARDTGRSAKTIRTWVNRAEVSAACVIAGRRVQFVNLDEVRIRHAEAKNRTKGAA